MICFFLPFGKHDAVSAPTAIQTMRKFTVLFESEPESLAKGSEEMERDPKFLPELCPKLASLPTLYEKALGGGTLCSKPAAGQLQLCMFGKQMFHFRIGHGPAQLDGGEEKNPSP